MRYRFWKYLSLHPTLAVWLLVLAGLTLGDCVADDPSNRAGYI